ncbi:MAG: glucose 1-dehydrogenase [Acidimicrobiales bacterium]|jgi:NAD(P)-dependent dehydrogenase (short-subunit alcohol dehydrogenase family)
MTTHVENSEWGEDMTEGMGRLEGHRAVITGAASGIGEATARLFSAEGAAVVIADVDDDRGKLVASECGDRAWFFHTDVSEEADVDAVVAFAADEFGGLDCMFNNAGNPGSVGGIDEIDMSVFDRTVSVHLRGVFLGIRAAARVMRTQGRGSIINTSSVAGLAANYGGHDYSACKAAIAHLTRTTANELGEQGIRVNAICPGGVATSIFGRAAGLDGDRAQATVETMSLALGDMQPIRRSGQTADIAEAALWLAGDGSSFVSGQAIAVDGGLTTGPLYREQHAKTEGLIELLRSPGF